MTDGEFNELLTSALKKITPTVREGVYTGEDADKYITYTYYVSGIHSANDRPTAKKWFVSVTLWARKGVPVYTEREKLRQVIEEIGGSYPSVMTATDNGWQQYVYEFYFVGGIENYG